MGSTEHTENRQPTAALAAVALSVGASLDDAWNIALEAGKQTTDEAAYREAFRLAGGTAYKRFDQA
ncbi:hypothetical protein ACFRJ9_05305 [Paenarthrobacter sp. NPDC056912]|uniref:hypothetical protein n=1 Tax=Paenarthrobacter sp. NPDC056912 TaxID=3345965 RepID=UPI00366BCB24